MNDTPWVLIANLHAGNKTSRKQWERIEECLLSAGILYVPFFTKRVGNARTYVKRALKEGYRKVLIMGGDGTLSEVIDGIMKSGVKTKRIQVCLLPLGTGNDWARYWGITSMQQAIELLIAGKTCSIDVFKVQYENATQSVRYGINAVGMGFDARVIQITNRLQKWFKGRSWTYHLSVFLAAIKHRSQIMQFTADTWSETFSCYTVSVGNGTFTGGGLQQTPLAQPTDGWLDVMAMGKLSFKSMLKAIKLLFSKRLLEHSNVRSNRISTLRVYSDKPIFTEVDGILQPVVQQLTVTVIPDALRFVCP